MEQAFFTSLVSVLATSASWGGGVQKVIHSQSGTILSSDTFLSPSLRMTCTH